MIFNKFVRWLIGSKFARWLSGLFICQKCGKQFSLGTFGYGEIICPNCYNGENQSIFFDVTYWLNYILYFFQCRKGIGLKIKYTTSLTTWSATKSNDLCRIITQLQQDLLVIQNRIAFFIQEFLLTNQAINIVRHLVKGKNR